MSNSIVAQRQTYSMSHQMMQVALGDLDPADALRQPREDGGSSIAFLVGHLVTGRHTVLTCAGHEGIEPPPWLDRFGGSSASTDGADYPPLGELAEVWNSLGPRFDDALAALDEEALAGPPGRDGLPLPEPNLRGLVTFMAFHESYHVGQVGLLRTQFGYSSIVQRFFELRRAAE
jgi:uncharacterized damage-inducible protein DinB